MDPMVAMQEICGEGGMAGFLGSRLVSDECEAACPGARSMVMERVDSVDMGRRLQPEAGGMLEWVCDNSDTVTCVVGAQLEACPDNMLSGYSMVTHMCTPEARLSMIAGMLPGNGTACEAACNGALDLMGDATLFQVDLEMGLRPAGSRRLSGHDDDPPPSLKYLARLRQFWCGAGKSEVLTCTNASASCRMDGGEDDHDHDDEPEPDSPETLVQQCDRPLAVTVSMALTVDDPTSFVQDPANKLAVEAGIANATGVDAGAVDAILTVARRLEEVQRRLQGAVNVDATIHTADPDAVATLQATVANVEADALTGAIAAAFQDAGISGNVSVTEIGEPGTAPTASAAAAAEVSANSEVSASGTPKATIASGILVIFAVTLRAQ